MKLAKLKSDISDFATMSGDTIGTYKRIVSKFYPNTSVHMLKEHSESVEEVLEKVKGKYLLREDQDKIKSLFKEAGIKSKNGAVSPNVIRDYLYQKNNYALEVNSKKFNGKTQRYWQFNRI